MTTGRYTTELAGRSIAVDVTDSRLRSTAVLYVDGEKQAEGSESLEAIELRADDVRVRVNTSLSRGLTRCELILTEETNGDGPAVVHRIALDPPPGTRAARLAEFRRRRPRLFAARHVVIATGQVVIAVLGIGALVRGLLPRVDVSFLDLSWLPDVDLSWIPDPLGWLFALLPDVSLPDWVGAIMSASKYWLPIVIAVLVAMNEVDKRRKAVAAKQQRDDP